VGRVFYDTASRRQRRQRPRKNGKVVLTCLIYVSYRSIREYACNALDLGAQGKQAAPASSLDARALFHDDDVIGPAGFDGCRAQMSRGSNGSSADFEFHSDYEACDPLAPGLLRHPGYHSLNLQPITGIRHRAAIQTSQTRNARTYLWGRLSHMLILGCKK
jgi:hypothetical protein